MSGTSDEAEEFLTPTALKTRGWSPRLIATVLGAPDRTTRRTPRRRIVPAKLYARVRVEQLEAECAAFAAYQTRRAGMSVRSKAIAGRKRAELLAAVEMLVVAVRIQPIDVVRAEAIAHWEDRKSRRRVHRIDVRTADRATHHRWMVNYVRHQLCSYDEELEKIAGRIGIAAAVTAIRRKVYAAIAAAYPALAAECARQAEAREVEP